MMNKKLYTPFKISSTATMEIQRMSETLTAAFIRNGFSSSFSLEEFDGEDRKAFMSFVKNGFLKEDFDGSYKFNEQKIRYVMSVDFESYLRRKKYAI